MIVLDTDHLSLLDRDNLAGATLATRLSESADKAVFVSIVTYEEQSRGWLAFLSKAKTPDKTVEAYRRLRRHIETYVEIPIVDFDLDSATRFSALRKSGVRIGTMDLRIAAICLVNDALLLTRNISDFRQVPGLRTEDWSTENL